MIDNSKYKPAPEELANNVRLATGLQGDVWLVNCADDMPPMRVPSHMATSVAVTFTGSISYTERNWAVSPVVGYSVGVTPFIQPTISSFANNDAGIRCLQAGLLGYRHLDNAFYVLPRPTVTFDERGRPHRDDGPAVIWPAGRVEYWLHGIRVPDKAFESEENLRIEALTNNNAEVRRVLTEKYGLERLMAHHGKVVHEDETGKLWRLERGNTQAAMVEVKNSTPEPDGSRRTYMLRVPPTVRTARGAVAWTFGMEAKDYKPELET